MKEHNKMIEDTLVALGDMVSFHKLNLVLITFYNDGQILLLVLSYSTTTNNIRQIVSLAVTCSINVTVMATDYQPSVIVCTSHEYVTWLVPTSYHPSMLEGPVQYPSCQLIQSRDCLPWSRVTSSLSPLLLTVTSRSDDGIWSLGHSHVITWSQSWVTWSLGETLVF